MNRYITGALISLIIIAVIAVGVGLFFSQNNQPPVTSQGDTPPDTTSTSNPSSSESTTIPSSISTSSVLNSDAQSQTAVQTAFQAEIASYNTDNVKLYQTVISGGYALQLWRGDNTGGEALLQYDPSQNRWTVITGGGGAWTTDDLVAAGVPRDTAAQLLTGMPH